MRPKRFIKNERGATAIEYCLIAALVAVALITALTSMGTSLSSMFSTVSTSVDGAMTDPDEQQYDNAGNPIP